MKFYKSLLLICLLIIITIPRFNWRPLPEPFNSFVGQKPFDVEQYEKYVNYFRGDLSLREELEAPFTYRPLIPFLASFIPFDPLTSINLINLLLLSTGLISLLNFLKQMKFSESMIFVGGLLFVLSFPVFYYATSGYIDASIVGIMSIANYFLFRNQYSLFIIFLITGVLIKETIIILIPVAFLNLLINDKSKKKYLVMFLVIISYLTVESSIRYIAPSKNFYLWNPSIDILEYNLLRVKTYLSFILTLGIPGLLSFALWFSETRRNLSNEFIYTLTMGAIMSLILWIYSIFSAYADGRQFWTSYVFTIPLSLFYLQQKVPAISKRSLIR